jgi:hypothetical protein
MTTQQRGIKEGKTRKGKLVYEKPKPHVHKKRSQDVEGPAVQVGSGAGDSCIDHASLPAARPSL